MKPSNPIWAAIVAAAIFMSFQSSAKSDSAIEILTAQVQGEQHE